MESHQALQVIKHINNFNFALITTMYDMENPLFLHYNKRI